jgi:hypothetical protein
LQLKLIIYLGLSKKAVYGEEKCSRGAWSAKLHTKFELNSRILTPYFGEYLHLGQHCRLHNHVIVKLGRIRPKSLYISTLKYIVWVYNICLICVRHLIRTVYGPEK